MKWYEFYPSKLELEWIECALVVKTTIKLTLRPPSSFFVLFQTGVHSIPSKVGLNIQYLMLKNVLSHADETPTAFQKNI